MWSPREKWSFISTSSVFFQASLEAKQKEGSPPREDTLTEEEGPVPEDAEEFTRQIPVGIYTIADDNEEEDKETSVQVIEQYPTGKIFSLSNATLCLGSV